MLGHLGAAEFVNLIEGVDLPRKKLAHLNRCPECRHTFESISTLREDLQQGGVGVDEGEAFVGDVDWNLLRTSVRDHLLARAVKRSSVVQRWTGHSLTPAAAWGVTFVLLVSLITAGGFWHYRTAHLPTDPWSPITQAEFVVDSSADTLLLGDLAVIEVEATAWADTDIFASLSELDSGEQEALRELIALAIDEVPLQLEEN